MSFNPRPCVRGDYLIFREKWFIFTFQSTPLCEGRPGKSLEASAQAKFQSTPLCEGRQYRTRFLDRKLDVSIHAPV